MNLFQSIVLAVVQGITEFLPVSSKGHLNLAAHYLNLTPSLSLDIFLNTASLLSVIYFFRCDTKYFFNNLRYIIVGSLPAAILGVTLKPYLEPLYSRVDLLPIFFFITAMLLFSTRYLKPSDNQMTYLKAFVIGLAQSSALLPGISRSGSTIFAGLLVGLSPVQAFNFSFALFIPASFGALLLDFHDITSTNFFSFYYLVCFIITTIVGVVALAWLRRLLTSRHLWYFGFYLGLLSLVLTLTNFLV